MEMGWENVGKGMEMGREDVGKDREMTGQRPGMDREEASMTRECMQQLVRAGKRQPKVGKDSAIVGQR